MVDDGDIVRRVGASGVDHVDEEASTLDVAEELKAEAVALVCALDEARKISHDVGVVPGLDDAEDRLQRGEGIVRDLRLRARDRGEQRRLASIGQTDKADVGEQLQLEIDPDLLAALAALGDVRRLVAGRGEVRVPAAALTAHGDPQPHAFLREFTDDLTCCAVSHDGARRYTQFEVGAVATMLLGRSTVTAMISPVLFLVPELPEAVDRAINHEHDIAPAATITAVGAAPGYVLLPAEADKPMPTISGSDFDMCRIDHELGVLSGISMISIERGNSWELGESNLGDEDQADVHGLEMTYVKQMRSVVLTHWGRIADVPTAEER